MNFFCVLVILFIMAKVNGKEDESVPEEWIVPKVRSDCSRNHTAWSFIDDEFKHNHYKAENTMVCLRFLANRDLFMWDWNRKTVLSLPLDRAVCNDRYVIRKMDFSKEEFYTKLTEEEKKRKGFVCHAYFADLEDKRIEAEKERERKEREKKRQEIEDTRRTRGIKIIIVWIIIAGVFILIMWACCCHRL